ncbi:YopX family protein [Prescottella equi]|uniref:YopX family protein n=1 Tax=Rhodococcus hoagii TaxID=43767 RepID=UPI001F5B5942|nr:YopX family protein [Prescottella equi]UNQ40928.1 YopX family protein [Prescottella equi]
MSREIKFRAWDEEYGLWVYFNLSDAIGGRVAAITDPLRLVNKCRATGLKDKNGVEIYEGDILKDTHDSGWQGTTVQIDQVIYSADPAGFTFGERWSPLNSHDIKRMEVIGNIYENPELLSNAA